MICKFGPLVSDARGKIGGTVFSRCRSGSFARSLTVPVFNQTNRRSGYEDAMVHVYSVWFSTLSIAQRAAWNTLGSNTNFTNALGVSYHPSGWNLFMRTNSLLRYFNKSLITVAPANATATHHPVTYDHTEPGFQMRVSVDNGWPDATYLFFWGSFPRRHTQYYNSGPFMVDLSGLAVGLKGGMHSMADFFYSDNDRVFLRDRAIDADGGVTAPYFQSYDLI